MFLRFLQLLLSRHVDNVSWVHVVVDSESSFSSSPFSLVVSDVVVDVPVLVSIALAVPPGEDAILLSGPAVRGQAPSSSHSHVP